MREGAKYVAEICWVKDRTGEGPQSVGAFNGRAQSVRGNFPASARPAPTGKRAAPFGGGGSYMSRCWARDALDNLE